MCLRVTLYVLRYVVVMCCVVFSVFMFSNLLCMCSTYWTSGWESESGALTQGMLSPGAARADCKDGFVRKQKVGYEIIYIKKMCVKNKMKTAPRPGSRSDARAQPEGLGTPLSHININIYIYIYIYTHV